jgi:hypothetical protein
MVNGCITWRNWRIDCRLVQTSEVTGRSWSIEAGQSACGDAGVALRRKEWRQRGIHGATGALLLRTPANEKRRTTAARRLRESDSDPGEVGEGKRSTGSPGGRACARGSRRRTWTAGFRRRAMRKKATIGRLDGVLACFTGRGRSWWRGEAPGWRQISQGVLMNKPDNSDGSRGQLTVGTDTCHLLQIQSPWTWIWEIDQTHSFAVFRTYKERVPVVLRVPSASIRIFFAS